MQSLQALVTQGASDQTAVPFGDGIYASRGIANCYLIATTEGGFQINTGLPAEAPRAKERFERVSKQPLRYIVFTQGHPDHVGGWSHFNAAGVKTLAQANHHDVREYWRNLHPFYSKRISRLWGAVTGRTSVPELPPEPVLTSSFADREVVELGDCRFELFSVPGGETSDGLMVWLPQRRTAFIGNLMGPMFGHLPNLYTVRGDKIRSAMAFIHSVERLIGLEAEVLINGHQKLEGARNIQQTLELVRDAVKYLRDQTIQGMNSGSDLWTLMHEVRLPAALMLPQTHGKVPWVVRAIWEEHVGWFRYESTTELYDVPASAVWTDIVEIAGPEALVERASIHVAQQRPLHAVHLVDMVLAHSPRHELALQVKRQAIQQLLTSSGSENFSEVQWLKSEISNAAASPR